MDFFLMILVCIFGFFILNSIFLALFSVDHVYDNYKNGK
jgi:hypothetical protein